jgi:hypothetical protein
LVVSLLSFESLRQAEKNPNKNKLMIKRPFIDCKVNELCAIGNGQLTIGTSYKKSALLLRHLSI